MKSLLSLLAALLLACNQAAAKPPREIVFHVAIVGGSASVCDIVQAKNLLRERFWRDIDPLLPISAWLAGELENDRPDLLTLDHFWDGSLRDYWFGKFAKEKRQRGHIRVILLPPLQTPSGPMYGGWSSGRWNGIVMMNVESANLTRNALAWGHEFGHQVGMEDIHWGTEVPERWCGCGKFGCYCREETEITIMYEDAMRWRDRIERYSVFSKRDYRQAVKRLRRQIRTKRARFSRRDYAVSVREPRK